VNRTSSPPKNAKTRAYGIQFAGCAAAAKTAHSIESKTSASSRICGATASRNVAIMAATDIWRAVSIQRIVYLKILVLETRESALDY